MFLKLGRDVVKRPRRARARVNAHNLREFRRFRKVTARCNICGHVGPLLYEMVDLDQLRAHHIGLLRETLRCRSCASKMRDRAIAAGLLAHLDEAFGVEAATIDQLATVLPPEVRILDTDAKSRIAKRLAGSPGVVRTLYDPSRPQGEVLNDDGALNLDLEQIPFPDESFDVVITSEVMEHVRHLDVAHREIARCLSPAGVYLFTVPYDPDLARTLVLIDPDTDEPLVWPMHIHGDPERSDGIKSYRVFGRDITESMRAAGLETRFTPVDDAVVGTFAADLFTARPLS